MNIKEETNHKKALVVQGKDQHKVYWESETPQVVRFSGDGNYYRIDVGDLEDFISALQKIQVLVREYQDVHTT